jgi:3-methyl-2-oxobutanoate hydroxymethyltransferase
MNIHDFKKMKIEKRKISMVTAYDFMGAKAVQDSEIDCILVGDSAAMVIHGLDSTIHATPEMMVTHTAAVRRGAPQKFIVADMPFLTFRKGTEVGVQVAGDLLKAGANAVKLESLDGHEETVLHIIQSGIPIMGHIGLTPQFIQQIGGYKVQGRNEDAQKHLKFQAQELERLGCFSIVLECVPQGLAQEIRDLLQIPVIGIGAGLQVDGQVLVYHDLLGLGTGHQPKFVRKFFSGYDAIRDSLNQFHRETLAETFPSASETYL